MVCGGTVSPREREMKLSRFLIVVDLMSQQNPVESMEGEWVELLQKMTTAKKKSIIHIQNKEKGNPCSAVCYYKLYGI